MKVRVWLEPTKNKVDPLPYVYPAANQDACQEPKSSLIRFEVMLE